MAPRSSRHIKAELSQTRVSLACFCTNTWRTTAGNSPGTLDELARNYGDYELGPLYVNVVLTTPGAVLRDLPEQSVIAVRTVPEEPNSIVVLRADFRVHYLSARAAVPPWSGPVALGWGHAAALGGWATALILWGLRRRDRARRA